jgi:hypothetical protein
LLSCAGLSTIIEVAAALPVDVSEAVGDHHGPEESMPPLPDFVLLAMAMKERFVDIDRGCATSGETPPTVDGQLPPTVLVEQDGRVTYAVHCRAPTPYECLGIVHLFHAMLNYEAILVAHELRMRFREQPTSMSDREILEEHHRKYKPGDFERLAKEGKAGEHGILDALAVHRFEAGDGASIMYLLPFLYSGPATPFSWLTSMFDCAGADGESAVGGDVPLLIRQVMRSAKADDIAHVVAALGGPRRISAVEHLRTRNPERYRQMMAGAMLQHIEREEPDAMLLTSFHVWGSLLPR